MQTWWLSASMLILVSLCAGVCGAEAPATKPTRQYGALGKARIEWTLATTVDVYEKYGKHDKKWDAAARSVIAAASREWGQADELHYEDHFLMINRALDAIKAGCDDPMVWYVRGHTMSRPVEKKANCFRHAAQGIRDSHYPAIRKVEAILESAGYEVRLKPDDEGVKKSARADVDEAFQMLPEALADPKTPDVAVGELLGIVMESSDGVERDGGVYLQRALDVMDKSPLPKAVVLMAKGRAYFDWAWRTRAGFSGDTGNKDALYRERFAISREALEESERLDPNRFETEYRLLCLDVGDMSHERDVMEKHFKRATELDPDAFGPYNWKFNWLMPTWYGSWPQAVEFGRECAKSKDWRSGAPLILIEAHWYASYSTGDRQGKQPLRKYFMDSPEIYDECKVVYEQYRKERELTKYDQTRWAVIAAYSGEFKEAHEIFKSLGKSRSEAVLYNNKLLDSIAKEAAEKAKD